MTATLTPTPKQQFFDANGNPLVGGKLYSYSAGTTSPVVTYVDSAGVTTNTNPIILDSRGEANVWLGTGTYKFKLVSATDVEIWTVDNIPGAPASNAALVALAASDGSSLVGYLPAGTGAVATTVQTKLREGPYTPQDVGATGLGVINDVADIQLAHDNIVATGKFGVLTLPSGSVFKCDSGLTINVSLVRIDGNGSKLDFSGMTSGYAITLTGKGTGTPYTQGVGGIRGVEVAGPGYASSVTGIMFNTASEAGPAQITLEGTSVHDFLVGHTFMNNAYCINIHGGNVYGCGTGVQQASGFANYGERISYVGNTIFNCATTAIDMQNANGAFVFTSCSFDYSTRVASVLAGRVFLNNCHVEASNYAAEPFYLSGSTGATLVMNGGWLLCTGTNTSNIAYVGTTASKGGGAFFRDVFMNNTTTATYFATGTGNIEVSNPVTYDTPSNLPILLRLDQSLAIDGGFEQTTPQDVFITSDTAAITSRLTGTDIQLASVAANPRSGSRSLKMTKVFDGGSACGFAFVAPLKAGKRYAGTRVWYAKYGSQTGTMYISYYFAAVRDSTTTPQIVKLGSLATTTITFTSSTVAYTAVTGGFDLGKAPAWATHIVMSVNADGVGAGDLYFDDFEAYEF